MIDTPMVDEEIFPLKDNRVTKKMQLLHAVFSEDA